MALIIAVNGCEPRVDVAADAGIAATQDGAERTLISNGYAQLYTGLGKLAWTDEIFLVRIESDRVDDFGSAVSELAGNLRSELEAVSEHAGWIDLDETGLPEVALRTIESSDRERLLSFAPFIGENQEGFERSLLLSVSGGLNHLLHLTKVLRDVESDPDRLNFLESVKNSLSDLYEADLMLLERVYFSRADVQDSDEESADAR